MVDTSTWQDDVVTDEDRVPGDVRDAVLAGKLSAAYRKYGPCPECGEEVEIWIAKLWAGGVVFLLTHGEGFSRVVPFGWRCYIPSDDKAEPLLSARNSWVENFARDIHNPRTRTSEC